MGSTLGEMNGGALPKSFKITLCATLVYCSGKGPCTAVSWYFSNKALSWHLISVCVYTMTVQHATIMLQWLFTHNIHDHRYPSHLASP